MTRLNTPTITTPTTDTEQPELKDSEKAANLHQPQNYREEVEDEKLRINPDRDGIAAITDLDGTTP